MDPVYFEWVILPLVILIARIGETSLKTIRQVYISKGFKYLAAGIGAGEVAIWLLSTGLVITHLTNIPGILAYIAGYVIGTILGIDLEDRLKVGNVIVRIITKNDPGPMMLALRDRGFGITRLDGLGSFGSQVSVLLVLVPRSEADQLIMILDSDYPDTIVTIEDIRTMRKDALFYQERKGGLWRFFGR